MTAIKRGLLHVMSKFQSAKPIMQYLKIVLHLGCFCELISKIVKIHQISCREQPGRSISMWTDLSELIIAWEPDECVSGQLVERSRQVRGHD